MKSIVLLTGLRYAALLLLVTDLSGGSPPARAQEASGATESGTEIQTVIVSARKREESLAQVPTSITAFTAETLKDYNVQSFADYASKTPNLSFTYGQGPTGFADARTVAIRGITGQNLFGTAGATGFYIDDTPVPGSVDPRVVDLSSIEVLKGPQGTLFGESSLGGNVRLITRQPDLNSSGVGYSVDAGATSGGGSPDGGGNLIANMALVPGTVALRLVAYANHDAGWITRTYPTDPSSPGAADPFLSVPRSSSGDQGANTSGGGSAALLMHVTDRLDIRLRLMFQDTKDHGFPTAFAPLPNFTVSSYIDDRAFDVQPYATDSWTLPTLDLKYSGSGWSAVWANSFFYRHTQDVEDSTYGTRQVLTNSPCPVPYFYCLMGLPAQPYLWIGDRFHDQVSSEARISFDPIHNVSGTFGLYYANTHTRFTIPDTYATGLGTATSLAFGPPPIPAESLCSPTCPPGLIWTQTNPGTQEDKSIFGELYYKFLDKWTLTLGGRGYWLNQTTDYTADGLLNFGATASDPQSNSQSGFNPKVALQLQATEEAMVYASASKGFRAGGAQANFPGCAADSNIPVYDITHIRSDTLWTYELGTKIQTSSVLISAAAYDIEWNNLQQQVALACGFYLQLNGNKARIRGGEIEANGRVTSGLQYRLGLGIEKSDITDPGNLALVALNGNPGIQPGTRVSGVPDFTAFVGGVYTHALDANTDGFVTADYSYTGNSVALLVGGSGAVATRPGYGLVNLRFGVDRGPNELSLNVHNLFNAKPNLGDIGYIGYVQLNQAGTPIPQVATLQPLTMTLQYTHSF
jgi:iron complex outermembrane recepter protein